MKIYNCFCSLLLVVVLLSCSDMNDLHDQYLENGEIIYTMKVDSVKVFPGKNRVMLRYFTTSPNAKKLLVYWNLRTESQVFDIPANKNAEDPVDVYIENLDEGPVYFELFTLNENMQNRSVPYNMEGYVYGDIYQQSLINRSVDAVVRLPGQPVIIKWNTASPNATSCLIKYTDQSGATAYQTVPVGEFRTVIPDVSEDAETIEYQTTYLPDPNAIIDVFSSSFTQVSIEEITERELDKSKFRRWNPPAIPYSGQNNWHIEGMWDNTWAPTPGALGYATGGTETDMITFDMGQVAKLTRFKMHFRDASTLVWWHYMLKKFSVYGSATPDVDADLSTWQYIGTFETVKPSGSQRNPPNHFTEEDREYAAYTGIDFSVADEAPYVRYILIHAEEIWGVPGVPGAQNTVGIGIQLMELTLWGYPEY